MPYYHGIRNTELNEGARAMATVATSTIGMVSVADDADPVTFPLNKPVLLDDLTKALGKAGDGVMAQSLEALMDQSRPPVVMVRVPEGEGADAAAIAADQSEKIKGGVTVDGQLTGMQALLGAESQLGLRPRILGVPGFDTQEVATSLATVAQKLRGFAYTAARGDVVADLIAYRANFASREQMLIWPDFSDFAGSAIARAMGLRAKIDEKTGWHKTLSNVAVNGVTGLSHPVPFSILANESTTASLLNDNDITTLARMNGYRFWGNRTCSDEPLFAFESAVRTAQVLQDTIAEGLVWAIDKPILPGLIRDILESINAKFRDMKRPGNSSGGMVIDAKASFRESDNSAAAMAAGKLVFDYEYTPCAPAESLNFNQRITDRFYAQLLAA